MVDRGYGRIVNISSVIGEIGNIGQANYSASKAGLFGLTMSLERECANKGITVNSVAPGAHPHRDGGGGSGEALAKVIARIPVGRLGETDEVARVVEFLVDPFRVHHRRRLLHQRRPRDGERGSVRVPAARRTTAARDIRPGTDDGLGATADPVAFGRRSPASPKRLARDPTAVGGAMVRLGLGVAQTGAIVTARALGAASEGPDADRPRRPLRRSRLGRERALLRPASVLPALRTGDEELAATGADEELGAKPSSRSPGSSTRSRRRTSTTATRPRC